jgi:D-methionine transport system substrate-binding protein
MVFISVLAGCAKAPDPKVLLVGTIAGPETELVEVAQQVAYERYGLSIKIVPFNDYVEPNRALAEGEITVNLFQHEPYLKSFLQAHAVNFEVIGKTFLYPMGVYSEKYQRVEDLPDHAIIGIPQDPSNQARALLLLEKAQLIGLNKTVDRLSATVAEITENPKGFVIHEIDPASMVRMLSDLDLAAINTNYAVMAGLLPKRDALLVEDKYSPYVNVVVSRGVDHADPRFKFLIEALHSPEVVQRARELFHDQAVVGW